MVSLHNILSIAKYERKTLFRSWFFRIFSVLSLLILFGMNFAMIIQGGGEDGWAIRSIPAAIPYINLLILNVAQAVIAVFLASDFLKRDKKLDTTEVIYMRSMTNGEYVIGKTWGNLQVFLILNIAVIIMALIFNLLAQNTSVNWASYGIYLLLISVPTLVFIMGLSFMLMSIIRNQAITFVLVLGYIGITLFLLQDKYYYIFDYMAFNIPMLISDMTGMGNMDRVLTHRGIYFSLGISFIFLTIYLLKRLPQSESMTAISLILFLLFLGAGGFLGYNHMSRFRYNESLRNEVVLLNNKYVKEPLPSTLAHAISFSHQGNRMEGVSTLTLKNETTEPLTRLIFSLNEGLHVGSLKINGQEIPFVREHHLIIVDNKASIAPEEQFEVEMGYSGIINENLSYLDIPELERQQKYGKFVLNVDKRYAFLTPQYVLLTSEALWYPKTGVTYSSVDVRWNQNEFIDFSLDVHTQANLKAVSQGEINETEPGRFRFTNDNPLTQVSLAIGNYEKKSILRDSMEFGVWIIKGHDYFVDAFPESADTIVQLIEERMGDFERNYKLEYPFQRLFIVEVPAQFKSYERTWTSRQEFVQPEMVLVPEKGYLLREADFEGSRKRMERWGRRGDVSMTEKDMEIRVLFEFFSVFTNERSRNFRGGGGNFNLRESASPYFIFPMLYNFQNNIQSQTWPITNRIFEAYLKSQATDMRAMFMQNMQGLSGDEMANIALQDSTFEEILADPKQKSIVNNVIKLKGEVLFSIVQWKAGQEEFEKFLRKTLMDYRFKNISFEQFDQMLNDEFGIELIPLMDKWFMATSLPGYLFSPIEAVKVKTGERMRTRVTLKVTNFSDTEGIVKFSFRLGGGGGPGRGFGRGPAGGDAVDKLVYLEPHQTKDLSYMLDADPRMVTINTMTSQNIPQMIMQNFRSIDEDSRGVPFEGEIISDVPVRRQAPGEIIVDNEDPQFEVTVTDDISLLEKWIHSSSEGKQKYSGMNYWRPPTNWTAVTNSDFFGEYVRSAYYIKSGDGSMKARWHVPVSEPGYYDVYYHMYKPRRFGRGGGGRQNEDRGEYQFLIHSDDGQEEQTLSIENAEEGWNHLGSFYFSPDTALIELTNRSESRIIFADAVRLLKL
jgi:ABC-type transport system involved in multi-copper enzyme maturation permease subunit